MSGWARSAVVPGYILLCLVLGGSVQGIWQNAVLQLVAIAIITWTLLQKPSQPVGRAGRGLVRLMAVLMSLFVAQLVPLPPEIWRAFPGRGFVAEGFALLGQQAPWLPVSLAPYETLATALVLLPPIAVLVAMLRGHAYRPSWIAFAILLGTFAAVLLGALQVGSADPPRSPWYLYSRTNYGLATGFFANSNHMASLMVISVPMLFALVQGLRDRAGNTKATSAILLLVVAGVLVLGVGIALNQSVAVFLLGPPALLTSASMLLPPGMNRRKLLWGIALAGAVAMLMAYMTPLYDWIASSNATSTEERRTMWSDTVSAISDFLPLGSGISTFPEIYPRYEDAHAITLTFTNHAHNDYLEIALETGLPGILLLFAFLIWWVRSTLTIWRSQLIHRYAQAATIVTGALMLHSIVDYPLRTAALSTVMAACLAIMAQPRKRQDDLQADLWETRHVAID